MIDKHLLLFLSGTLDNLLATEELRDPQFLFFREVDHSLLGIGDFFTGNPGPLEQLNHGNSSLLALRSAATSSSWRGELLPLRSPKGDAFGGLVLKSVKPGVSGLRFSAWIHP